jgi:isoquinoline 1-oxidoreductase beta subunit
VSEQAKRRWRPTRRGFLIAGGLAGGGLALGLRYGLPEARLKMAGGFLGGGEAPGSEVSRDPMLWFEVLPEDRIRLYVNKVEMGQGIHAALGQIALEELEIGWDRLEVQQASTARGLVDSFGTAGSTSVSQSYQPLREAAATLRELLRGAAAEALGAPLSDINMRDGGAELKSDPAQRIGFWALVEGRDPETWVVPEEPPELKPRAEFRVIGAVSNVRPDIEAKVMGTAVYGYDARVEGMAYGAVARPPQLGARLKRAAVGSAEQGEGVIRVVIEEGFAGVVARSRAAARAAVAKLDLEWEGGRAWQQAEIEEMVRVGGRGGVTVQREGDGAAALDAEDGKAELIEAEYQSPMAIHASMECQAALVDVRPEGAKAWLSTQFPDGMQGELAKLLGLEPEQVEVIPAYVGGGFGRKYGLDVMSEAARLSRAAGMPVHVGWDRGEEMRHGYLRPPTHHKLRARLSPEGRIVAMEHLQSSGNVAADFLPPAMTMVLGFDFAAARGALLPYDGIAHRHVKTWRHSLPIPTGWWRGLGLLPNTFAIESFMDLLAERAGADPLQFRLDHLGDSPTSRRLAAVLEAAAERAGWGAPLPEGKAMGLACCSDADTMVAQIALVSLDEDGAPRVERITCAVDCGLVIHPDGALAQVQGNIIMGLGSTLIEEAIVKDGRVTAGNFDGYPLLTLDRAPEIDVVFVEAADGRPRGLGEPPIGPVAAAVGNAVRRLTGVGVDRIPIGVG